MKKKKVIIVILTVAVAAAAVAVWFYGHILQNAGRTMKTLQRLTEGNGYRITADCTLTLQPSDELKPAADLFLKLFKGSDLSVKLSAEGESAQKNLKLQLKEAMTGEQLLLAEVYLVDETCYFGIDSMVSAIAGDEIEKNPFFKAAYNGWIRDHCMTSEQLMSLVYDLTGIQVENKLKMPGGMDAVLFLIEPDHLFDPKLWSAIRVSKEDDNAAVFAIDADYFAQLVGINPEQTTAELMIWTDSNGNYRLKLSISFSADDGNMVYAEITADAEKMKEKNTIEAPALLLTDEQVEQIKQLAKALMKF